MVNQRSRKPSRKAPPRVQDIAAATGKPAPEPTDSPEGTTVAEDDARERGDRSAEPDLGEVADSVGEDAAGDAAPSDAEAAPGKTPAAERDAPDEAPVVDAPGEAVVDSDDAARTADASTDDEASARSGPDDETAPSDVHDDEASGAAVDAQRDPEAADAPADAPALDPDDPLAAALAGFDAPRPAPPGVQLSDEIPIDPEDDLRAVEGEASLRLVSILESLLFAAAKPLRVQDLRKVLAETSKHQIQLALKHLMRVTAERGVVLAQVAGGFQFRTHPDNAVWVQKMLQSKPARLSRTQIETLAIVAYRQPITRPEIDDVRGVDSGAVLKTLLERELIQIVGKKEEPGRPLLYGTTVRFLEFFNLRGLRDLPTLRDFRDLSEESKATLRAKLGESEAEAMGQGVLGLDAEDGAKDMSEETGDDAGPADAAAPDDATTPDSSDAAPEGAGAEGAAGAIDATAPDGSDPAGSTDAGTSDSNPDIDAGSDDAGSDAAAEDTTNVEHGATVEHGDEPDTGALEPDDAETAAVEPDDDTAAEPDDDTDPDIAAVELDTTAVELDTAAVEPDVDTDAVTVEPDELDTAAVEPEELDTAAVERDDDTDAAAVEPDELDAATVEPDDDPPPRPTPADDAAPSGGEPPVHGAPTDLTDVSSDRERTPGDPVAQVTAPEDMSVLADRTLDLADAAPGGAPTDRHLPVADAPGDPFLDDPTDRAAPPGSAPGSTGDPDAAADAGADEPLSIDDVER